MKFHGLVGNQSVKGQLARLVDAGQLPVLGTLSVEEMP